MKVSNYRFGVIQVDGKTYKNDIVISWNGVLDPFWWRREGHKVFDEDLKFLDEAGVTNVHTVVIGSGYNNRMEVQPEVREELKNRGVNLMVQSSLTAVQTYNALIDEGRRAILAIHVTC